MKKILTCLLLFLWIGNVYALEYSDYYSYIPEGTNQNDLKVERRYKYYKIVRDYGTYNLTTTDEYPLVDEEDYIYQEFSDWSKQKPEEKEDRIIETKEEYHYQKAGSVDTITIIAKDTDVYLDNFKFYNNETQVEYQKEYGTKIEAGKSLIITLNEKVDLENLKYYFEGIASDVNYYKFKIELSSNQKVYQLRNIEMTSSSKQTIICKNYAPYKMDDYYTEEEFETNKFLVLKEKYTLYRYQDKLYHIYNTKKQYYNDYLTEPFEDYIYKDEELYKDYYAVKINQSQTNETQNTTSQLKTIPTPQPVQTSLLPVNNEETTDSVILSNVDYKNYSEPVKLENNNVQLWYIFPLLLIFLSIIILVLSKLYKKQK